MLFRSEKALKIGYNIIICTDEDILSGQNLVNFQKLVKTAPKNVFVIFNNLKAYQAARAAGVTTGNMSNF